MYVFFFLPIILPSKIPRLTTDPPVRVFPGVRKLLSFFKTPFLGWISIPTSFISMFIFYILSYLLSKTMGCFSGCLMSSASIQKLFCGICLAFKCSFDEFVGEKVVSPSYSSAILGPPPHFSFKWRWNIWVGKAFYGETCVNKSMNLRERFVQKAFRNSVWI